jgi:hypothetical protein
MIDHWNVSCPVMGTIKVLFSMIGPTEVSYHIIVGQNYVSYLVKVQYFVSATCFVL